MKAFDSENGSTDKSYSFFCELTTSFEALREGENGSKPVEFAITRTNTQRSFDNYHSRFL